MSVDKEKIWVPDRNRTHDFTNTGQLLHPLSYENSWRGRSCNRKYSGKEVSLKDLEKQQIFFVIHFGVKYLIGSSNLPHWNFLTSNSWRFSLDSLTYKTFYQTEILIRVIGEVSGYVIPWFLAIIGDTIDKTYTWPAAETQCWVQLPASYKYRAQ